MTKDTSESAELPVEKPNENVASVDEAEDELWDEPEEEDNENDEPESNDLFEVFGRNVEAEEKGAWLQVEGRSGRKTDVLVLMRSLRSAAGQKYRRLLDRYTKMAQKKLRTGQKLTSEQEREINARAFVDSAVLDGWKNVSINGKSIPWSKETAIEILGDPVYDVFFATLIGMAADLDGFKHAIQGETEKNS